MRGTSAFDVENVRHAVLRTLQLAAKEHGDHYPCDIFVFGHTHRAGITTVQTPNGPVTAVNAGCWLRETGKNNRQNEGTFVFIDSECISIYFQAPDLTIVRQQEIELPGGARRKLPLTTNPAHEALAARLR